MPQTNSLVKSYNWLTYSYLVQVILDFVNNEWFYRGIQWNAFINLANIRSYVNIMISKLVLV